VIFIHFTFFSIQGDPEHPICPVMLSDARLASLFADEMLGISNYQYLHILIMFYETKIM